MPHSLSQNRFLSVLRTTKLPKRRDNEGKENEGYQEALTAVHSAVLGASALVSAFPYSAYTHYGTLLVQWPTLAQPFPTGCRRCSSRSAMPTPRRPRPSRRRSRRCSQTSRPRTRCAGQHLFRA